MILLLLIVITAPERSDRGLVMTNVIELLHLLHDVVQICNVAIARFQAAAAPNHREEEWIFCITD